MFQITITQVSRFKSDKEIKYFLEYNEWAGGKNNCSLQYTDKVSLLI